MDAMAFGMGACALQCTFGTESYNQARFLYDQFVPLGPLFMALSAGSPIFKGELSGHDTKFSVISQSVDCRTPEEMKTIPKSRYSGVNYYISNSKLHKAEYNDVKSELNEEIMEYCRVEAEKAGVEVDDQILQHIGYLFSRDAMVIFDNTIHDNDEGSTRHFEQFNSSNWHSMRFKPPPDLKIEMPWRVEFRSMELQPKISDNLKFCTVIELLSKIICEKEMDVNFYMPISLVDENQEAGYLKNAAIEQKFWFRKDIQGASEDEYIQLTLEEILLGKENEFKGLKSLMADYFCLQYKKLKLGDFTNYKSLEHFHKAYLTYQKAFEFVVKKAQGKLPTYAAWLRDYIVNHPEYQNDCKISDKMAYEIVSITTEVTKGKISNEVTYWKQV